MATDAVLIESGVEQAWVGLGANLDDPLAQVRSALRDLDAIVSTRLVTASSLYRSAPWGGIEQPPFVNAVAQLETRLAPHELLDALLAIERRHGRVRDGERWGPRTLDLDLLVHGDRRVATDALTLPHPHLAERAFVLVPLAEIAPDLRVSGVGVVGDLLARIDATQCERLASA